MREMRLPKGWHTYMSNSPINVETPQEFTKRMQKWDKLIRNTPKKSAEDLAKQVRAAEHEAESKKAFYEAGKAADKLWSKKQKEASKRAKKEARRAKRLAAKSN